MNDKEVVKSDWDRSEDEKKTGRLNIAENGFPIESLDLRRKAR